MTAVTTAANLLKSLPTFSLQTASRCICSKTFARPLKCHIPSASWDARAVLSWPLRTTRKNITGTRRIGTMAPRWSLRMTKIRLPKSTKSVMPAKSSSKAIRNWSKSSARKSMNNISTTWQRFLCHRNPSHVTMTWRSSTRRSTEQAWRLSRRHWKHSVSRISSTYPNRT